MAKRIMRAFKMNEISAVDRPAQEHARFVIMKRDFSASERRSDAKSGAAMPDGSFPIENAEDLANARRLVGHAKDPAAARAHIASRAKALGLSKLDGLIEEYLGQEDNIMDLTKDDIQKAVDDAVKPIADKLAETEKELAVAKSDLVKAGMTPEERAYYDKAGDVEKASFANSTHEIRKVAMQKAIDASIPDHIRKQLAEAEDLKKRLAALEDDKAAVAFSKRASDLGLEGHGETLRKAYGGNAEAIVKLESLLKGLAEQVRTGKIFAEFGSNQSGAGATAIDEMNAAATAYRADQIKIGKKCSPEQAFTAIYTDPSHADLKKRYDDEEIKKRRAA